MASFISLRTGDGEVVHINLAYVVAIRLRRSERRATLHIAHIEPLTIQGKEFDHLLAELEHAAHLDMHVSEDA